MAPLANALAEVMLPIAHQLLVRDSTSNSTAPKDHQGKTEQQWEAEGRYNYAPSFAAAVVFCALYILITVTNLFQFIWYRAWFWWPMIFAILLELVGYISRAISIKHLDSQGPFIAQLICILVAPAVMAAACYMAFGRVLLWVVPKKYQTFHYLWMPFRRITPLFVTFDVLSFFIQCLGGAIVASGDTASKENKGKNIILIGLGIQLATFGFFCIASIRFTFVLRTKLRNEALPRDTNWPLLLGAVNAASATILIRSIYRFIEYAIGVHNYLSDHEAYFYCLDALLIFAVVGCFIVIHPGQYIPYLGLRRKRQEFSKHAGQGLFSRLSKTKNQYDAVISPNAAS